MTKKILVTGPESSGKTTLCNKMLNWLPGAIIRPEQARIDLEQLGRTNKVARLKSIWKAQVLREQQLAAKHGLLICDTAHFVMAVWNEVVFQEEELQLPRLIADLPLQYNLIMLCSPDLPWVADPLREAPDLEQRQRLFDRYAELMQQCGLHYEVLNGQGQLRDQNARMILRENGFSVP